MKKYVIMVAIAFAAAFPVMAQDQNRFALVFGNAAYEGDAALAHSVNDATDMAAALTGIGWKVTRVLDADRKAMNKAVASFRDAMSGTRDPIALLYYAGHGVQIGGQNFLIPVHETFESPDDIKDDAISLQSILDTFDDARVSTEVVILDACRDNPFEKKMSRSLGGTRGLSVVAKSTEVEGSAVLFATAPGQTAADGSGRNGVFTQALPKYINSDMKLQDLVTKVTGEVKSLTGGKQVPTIRSACRRTFIWSPPRFARLTRQRQPWRLSRFPKLRRPRFQRQRLPLKRLRRSPMSRPLSRSRFMDRWRV